MFSNAFKCPDELSENDELKGDGLSGFVSNTNLGCPDQVSSSTDRQGEFSFRALLIVCLNHSQNVVLH